MIHKYRVYGIDPATKLEHLPCLTYNHYAKYRPVYSALNPKYAILSEAMTNM
jgi:hypothetical protein